MNGFLLHLQAPMMSFGHIGFGQIRDAGPVPSRSSVIGIIGAALGIERDGEELLQLHQGLRVHVGTVAPGTLAVDYHTVATAGYEDYDPARLRRGPKAGTNPSLTDRTYHMDAHFVALVEGNDTALVNRCRDALDNPVYTAFLGRRSCPPGIPLKPTAVSHESIVDALCDGVISGRRMRTTSRRGHASFADAIDLDLDGTFHQLTSTFGSITTPVLTYRRDLLVALPRSYVTREASLVRVVPNTIPAEQSPDTNEEFFDAAP